ncbi:lantibiotic dehydratase C-terminal domain-containing protein [Streptococcus sp. ZY1909104]|uniref:lantibiotic dehydratase C-terminal domain-containing protein n=1 Tax=Streptococcus sp. ZY1909104 TaxID=3233335 RepID=UPI00349FCDC5
MWYNFKIYYYKNQDELLTNMISAYFDNNSITDFFFIRYWEGGPHIRLRVKKNSSFSEKDFIQKIKDYMEKVPSVAVINEEYLLKSMENLALQENIDTHSIDLIADNSVIIDDYLPEIGKYGNVGIKFAEKEFVYSSHLALLFLNFVNNSIEKKLIAALFSVNLVLITLDKKQMTSFFEYYTSYWSKYLVEDSLLKVKDNLNKFDPGLIPIEFVNEIEGVFKQTHFNIIHSEIFEQLKIQETSVSVAQFLFNFIHLFNNRLGIKPEDEIVVSLLGEKIINEKLS